MNESQKQDEDLLSVFSDSDDEDNHEKEPNNVHENILTLPALHGSDRYTTNQNGSKVNVTNSHLDICNGLINQSQLNNISNRDDIDNLIGKGTTLPIINKPWKEIQSEYRKKLSSEYMNTESTKSYKTYCALCHTQGHIYCYDCEYVYCKQCWKFKHMEIHEERKLQLLPSSISHTSILSTESRHTPHNPTPSSSSSSNAYNLYSNSLFNASIVSDKLYTPNNSFANIYSATIGHDSSVKKINQKINNDEDMNNHLLRIEGCIAPTYSTYDKIRQKSPQTSSTHNTYMSSKDINIKMMTSSPSTSTASMYTLPTTSTLTSSMPSLPTSNTLLIPTHSSSNISVNQYPSLVLDPLYVQPSYTIVPSLSLIPIDTSNSMKSDAGINSSDIIQECNFDTATIAVTTTTSTTSSTKDMTAILGTISSKSFQDYSIDATTNDTTTSPSQQPFAKYIAKKKAALRVYQPKRIMPSKHIVILYDNKKIHTHTFVHSSDTTTATSSTTTASTSYALDSSNNILEMQSLQDEKNSDINTKEIQTLSSRPSTRWKPNQQSTWGHSKNRLLTPLSAATLNLRPLVSPRTSHRYTHINDETNGLEGTDCSSSSSNSIKDELMTSYSASHLHTIKTLNCSPKATTIDNHFSSRNNNTNTTVSISSNGKLNIADNMHSLTTANDFVSIAYSSQSLPNTHYPDICKSAVTHVLTSSKLTPNPFDDKVFSTIETDLFADIDDKINITDTNDLNQASSSYIKMNRGIRQSHLNVMNTSNKDPNINLSDSIKISTLQTKSKMNTLKNTNSDSTYEESYNTTETLHNDVSTKLLVIDSHHHTVNTYHTYNDIVDSTANHDKENKGSRYDPVASLATSSSLSNLQVTGTSSHITTTYTVTTGSPVPNSNHSRSHSPLLRLGYKDRYLTPLSPSSSSPLTLDMNPASSILTASPNQPLHDLLIVNSRESFIGMSFNNHSRKLDANNDDDDCGKHENTDMHDIQKDYTQSFGHDGIQTNHTIDNRIEIDYFNRIDDMTSITDDVTTSDGRTLSAPNSTILKPLHMTSQIHIPEDLWYTGKTRPDICVKIKTATSIQHDQSLESNQNSPILASAHSIIQYHKAQSILPIHMNMLSLSPIQKPHMKNMSLKKVTYVSHSSTQDMSMSRFKLSKL